MKKINRGFTLIELLVVIAIIGILSAIVLASLSTARAKATDSKVQGQLSSMRAAAEIYYSNNSNSYGTAAGCGVNLFADSNSGMASLISASNNAGGYGALNCNAAGTTWGVVAPLSSNKFFCVDSTGKSGSATNINLNSGVCY